MSIDENNSVFEKIKNDNHEQLVFCNDDSIGLKAIIGIHNTVLGPAIGGTRMWNYNSDAAALKDVINLSKAMSYKSSLAGLNAGGGKAVIIGDPKIKSEKFIKRFGDFINDLNGKYWTAQDVNMSTQDIIWIKEKSKFVVGLPKEHGGLGDSSSPTAFGVYMGIKASVKERFNRDSLEGLKISVQGLGHVGTHLVDYLSKDGMQIYVTDIDNKRIDEIVSKYGCTPVDKDEILNQEVDIYAPCALGATVNKNTIPLLNCEIIAGAANNVLENSKSDSESLVKRNILYAPDYVINAGGLINVANELEGYDKEKAFNQAEKIYDTLSGIFKRSKKESITTTQAATLQAEDRIKKIATLKSFYLPYKKTFNLRND